MKYIFFLLFFIFCTAHTHTHHIPRTSLSSLVLTGISLQRQSSGLWKKKKKCWAFDTRRIFGSRRCFFFFSSRLVHTHTIHWPTVYAFFSLPQPFLDFTCFKSDQNNNRSHSHHSNCYQSSFALIIISNLKHLLVAIKKKFNCWCWLYILACL